MEKPARQWMFLRAVRERGRVELVELARRIGLSSTHLGRIENGRAANPSWRTVEAWGRELGVSMRLIGYIQDHPAVDELVADWAARMVVGMYPEEQIIDEIEARYGPIPRPPHPGP